MKFLKSFNSITVEFWPKKVQSAETETDWQLLFVELSLLSPWVGFFGVGIIGAWQQEGRLSGQLVSFAPCQFQSVKKLSSGM